MYLNTISPDAGSKSKAKRVGRGIGSTHGKTCGRGHKGQKSRSGGFHKVGFEGGQMPLQRRLPKVGFVSRKKKFVAQINLAELNGVDSELIDLSVLKEAGLINNNIRRVKVFSSGKIEKPKTLRGIKITKSAKNAIESAGGTVEA